MHIVIKSLFNFYKKVILITKHCNVIFTPLFSAAFLSALKIKLHFNKNAAYAPTLLILKIIFIFILETNNSTSTKK